MRFTIQRETLLKPLQFINSVVERKQILPILSNVLLTIKDKHLFLTGTNLEMELKVMVSLEGAAAAGGGVTVSARKLMDICRALPEQTSIDFCAEDQCVILKAGRSRFTLMTLLANEFPNIDDSPAVLEFSLSKEDFGYLIGRTHFAIANQDVRYYLNGMLLEIGSNEIRAVATDGHRLALAGIASPPQGATTQIIIPRKGVYELMRLFDDLGDNIDIIVGTSHIKITADNYIFTSKLIDGRFPDYERVLPKAGDKTLTIERDFIKGALARVAILSNEKCRGACFQLRSGLLRIVATNPDQEEAEEELSLEYQGDDLDISFNVNYLLDIFSTLEANEVRLTLSDADSSLRIEEVGTERAACSCVYVVMPMRL